MNLQDARHVISYDLPWNPVRLMQRIGRVDRLGSPHNVIVPHIFLPGAGLEDLLGLMRRLRSKLRGIADTVGGDDAFELMALLAAGDTEAAARVIERVADHGLDSMDRLRLMWRRMADRRDPAAAGAATTTPPSGGSRAHRAHVLVGAVATPADAVEVATAAALVLVRDRDRTRLVEVVERHGRCTARDPGATAARLLQASLDARVFERPPLALRRARRVAGAALAHLSDQAATARAPSPIRAADPTARIARALRSALASPGTLGRPATIARADRLLQRLAVPLPSHAAAEAARLLETTESTDAPETIMDRVEELLDRCRGSGLGSPAEHQPARTDSPRPEHPVAVVIAVLMTAAGTRPGAVDDPDMAG